MADVANWRDVPCPASADRAPLRLPLRVSVPQKGDGGRTISPHFAEAWLERWHPREAVMFSGWNWRSAETARRVVG